MTELKIKCVTLGSPRQRGEGLRIGTVRRLPQRVSKADYAKDDWFDLWFPMVAPSKELLEWFQDPERVQSAKDYKTFLAKYERELLKDSERRQALILLAEMAKKTPISIGCYCEDEKFCYRSTLLKLIKKAGTKTFQHARK